MIIVKHCPPSTEITIDPILEPIRVECELSSQQAVAVADAMRAAYRWGKADGFNDCYRERLRGR